MYHSKDECISSAYTVVPLISVVLQDYETTLDSTSVGVLVAGHISEYNCSGGRAM